MLWTIKQKYALQKTLYEYDPLWPSVVKKKDIKYVCIPIYINEKDDGKKKNHIKTGEKEKKNI